MSLSLSLYCGTSKWRFPKDSSTNKTKRKTKEHVRSTGMGWYPSPIIHKVRLRARSRKPEKKSQLVTRNEGLGLRSCSSQERTQAPSEAMRVRTALARVALVWVIWSSSVLTQRARRAALRATRHSNPIYEDNNVSDGTMKHVNMHTIRGAGMRIGHDSDDSGRGVAV